MLGQEILRTVSSLTHEQRVAFAAGVAERVLDIYAGVAKPYRSSVEAAIDAVWTATEIGEGNVSRLRDLRSELEDMIAPYAEEPDLGYSALMAISRAVDAAITGDELMVEQAALHASSAVDLTDRGEHGAAMEEDAFQRRWLDVCRRTDPSSLRAVFRNLNTERPGWLERWES
jgi:hypothetical protein